MGKVIKICLIICILMTTTNAFALPTWDDGPNAGDSWWIGVSASGIGSYDLVAVKIASGSDVFESPAIRNISNPSWNMVLDLPTLASFSGPSVTSLNWDLYFAGSLPMATTLELDWAIFNGEQLTTWTHWVISEQGTLQSWSFKPQDGWQPQRSEVIPAPGAILLGGIGVGLIGWLRRRRSL